MSLSVIVNTYITPVSMQEVLKYFQIFVDIMLILCLHLYILYESYLFTRINIDIGQQFMIYLYISCIYNYIDYRNIRLT